MPVTGEVIPLPARPSTQPGGRAPAPGELSLVQAFVNTHYDLELAHGAELLADAASLTSWLRDRGLIDRSAALREAARDRR